MGSLQASSTGFVHAMAGSLFGINFEATSKNREIGGALALGGRHSINTYNNQKEVGVWGGGYIRRKRRGGMCGGGEVPSFLPSNGDSKTKKNKITSWP
jgi:hypothetical protein